MAGSQVANVAAQRANVRQEWRRNWTVVLAAAVGMGLLSVPTYSMGIFLKPIEEEFGWSRAAISSGKLFGAVSGLLLGPVIGLVIDHFGARRLALVGSVLVCLLFGMLSLTGPNIVTWWSLWGALALAAILIKPTIWTAGVSSLFTAGRGFALAVTLSGTALASVFTPILASMLIDSYGWRVAYVALATIWAALSLPLIFIFFDSAHDRHRKADGQSKAKPLLLPGVSAREGLLSWRFARLCLGAFLATLIAASFVTTLVPVLTSFGHSTTMAATIAGAMGLSTIVGRLLSGVLSDRVNANFVAAGTMLLPVGASLLLLLHPGSIKAVTMAAILLGVTLGAKLHFVAYLTGRHFGLRSFGVLFGTISGLFGLGTGIGPILLNYSYDIYGAYDTGIAGVIPVAITAGFIFLTLGRYPDFSEPFGSSEDEGRSGLSRFPQVEPSSIR